MDNYKYNETFGTKKKILYIAVQLCVELQPDSTSTTLKENRLKRIKSPARLEGWEGRDFCDNRFGSSHNFDVKLLMFRLDRMLFIDMKKRFF